MDYDHSSRRRFTIVIIFALIVLLCFIGFFVYSSLRNSGKIHLRVVTVPANAEVSVDGKATKRSSGGIYVNSGKHRISASYPGFKEGVTEIEITQTSDNRIVLALLPQTAEANQWADKNQKAYRDAENLAGEIAQAKGQRLRSDNPIIDRLPYRASFYSIDYGSSDNTNLRLVITAETPLARQVALAQIRSWGYEPTDFSITFKQYKNPFTGESI